MSDPVTAPDGAPAAAPAAAAPAFLPLALPAACFAASAPFIKMVPLQFGPYSFGGRDWTHIGIRRLTVEQIAAVFENYRANLKIDPAFPLRMPVYVDEVGVDVPAELLAKLDQDDRDDVEEAAAGFLPRRYRVDAAPGPSAPATGEATAPSSSG